MKLSENFTLEELIFTETGLNNYPNNIEIENLKKLVVNILQPLRNYIKRPIHINSCFRNPIVNREVDGANNSAHLFGRAADITLGNKKDNELMFNWIKNNCKFRQLINEKNFSWVHVEYNEKDNKKQLLVIK